MALLSSIAGVITVSLLVVTFNNFLTMDASESSAFVVMKRLQVKQLIKSIAAKLIVTINRKHKTDYKSEFERYSEIKRLIESFRSMRRVYRRIYEPNVMEEFNKCFNQLNGHVTDLKDMIVDQNEWYEEIFYNDDSNYDTSSEKTEASFDLIDKKDYARVNNTQNLKIPEQCNQNELAAKRRYSCLDSFARKNTLKKKKTFDVRFRKNSKLEVDPNRRSINSNFSSDSNNLPSKLLKRQESRIQTYKNPSTFQNENNFIEETPENQYITKAKFKRQESQINEKDVQNNTDMILPHKKSGTSDLKPNNHKINHKLFIPQNSFVEYKTNQNLKNVPKFEEQHKCFSINDQASQDDDISFNLKEITEEDHNSSYSNTTNENKSIQKQKCINFENDNSKQLTKTITFKRNSTPRTDYDNNQNDTKSFKNDQDCFSPGNLRCKTAPMNKDDTS